MKKQLVTLGMMFMMATTSVFAAGKDIKVSVKGMVCGFCAQGIEKKLHEQDSVEKVNVNLKDKLVTVNLKDGKSISDEEIKKILTDSGYNIEKIERD